MEPGSAKAVYQATMEKNIEQWPVELQKTFERKNKKCRRRGKTELTIEKYMENLRTDGEAYADHENKLIAINNKICNYASYVYGDKK